MQIHRVTVFVFFFFDFQAHRRTHNKVGRKTRAKKADVPQFELVEMVKEEEEFDIDYVDEQYENEFISPDGMEQ